MILVDLIIDGNYMLSRNVFALHKSNLLFGALYRSLEQSVSNYKKWFPFSNVYLVSDSKEKSWRKKIDSSYKETRKKSSDIDWTFVMETYNTFKQDISNNTKIKVLESPHIEGDDWISFISNQSNLNGRSTIIISNDYDIKQLINFNINPCIINIMSNEIFNKQKIFLPKNFQIFLNEIDKMNNNDIFNLNDNNEFLSLINNIREKYDVVEVDNLESLILKVISGDKSDNISSVYQVVKNGKKRGIGDSGAKKIYDIYQEEFGEVMLSDPDLYDNISDIICENKKIGKSNISDISNKISHNMKLIHLDISNLPNSVISKMKNVYESI